MAAGFPLSVRWSHHALLPCLWCQSWDPAPSLLWSCRLPLHTPKHGCRGGLPPQLLPTWAQDGRQTEKPTSRASFCTKQGNRIHTEGLTHTRATHSKEPSRGLKITIASLQVPVCSGSVLTPGGPLGLLPSSFFSACWLTRPSLLQFAVLKGNFGLARISRQEANWVPPVSNMQ